MPIPTTSDLPKPKSWDEFEDLVWDVYKREWQDPDAQRYGRSGQRQNGVDIYGQQNGSGGYIAVQCKRYEDGKLNSREIEEEVSKAESFSSVISKFIIATTESRDTKIQDCVRCLNKQRQPEGKFSVHVVFWDDLCNRLTNPDNHDLLKKHYSGWAKIFKISNLDIDWCQISQRQLERQQQLTTNFLTRNEGITHSLEQVYVPLGLVERKKSSRRQHNVTPEEGSKLYRETEITQTFEHEQFLDQVIRQQQSPKSKGRRIAIIGEPGAGKTTLLQQIAQLIANKKLGQVSIVWVSLSALDGQTLEVYLLERWLKEGLQVAHVSPEQENAFVEWFKFSQVWLLLDGADEMSTGTHASPLQAISDQITGWVGEARIILTCRQNLWDSNAQGVEGFDVYRTLEFSYPTQVEKFIKNWFAPLADIGVNQGQRLCAVLSEPGRERIQDLVKNPLLLTLLCIDWRIREGKLPETRADLYQQFIEDFYHWKQNELRTTSQQRQHLITKLSELARGAIEQETNRFCLRQDFICQLMGDPEDEDSLFYLALKLGWLNKVGVDTSNPRKSVYAFLHPTFEEYFAASMIAKQFQDKNLTFEQLQHDVFGRYWQDESWHEVLLLICGKIGTDIAEQIIEFLIYLFRSGENVTNQEFDVEDEFEEEGCSLPEYFYRSYNFNSSSLSLALAIFQEIKCDQISKTAHQEIANCLKDHLENLENFIESVGSYTWDYAAETYLYRIFSDMAVFGNGNKQIFQYLESKAFDAPLQEICSAAIRALVDNWKNDSELLELLLKVAVENPFDTSTFMAYDPNLVDSPRETALEALFIRYSTHPKTLKLLQDRALNDSDESVRWYAAQALAQLSADNHEALNFLFSVAKNYSCDSEYTYKVSPRCTVLGAIVTYCSTHPKTLELLQELVLIDPDEQLRLWVAEQLEQWEPSKSV